MSTKLFTFASLLALASALPHSTLSQRRAQNTECWQTNPGTSFYRCDNGYVGCFASDPCALPAKPVNVYELTKPRSYNIYVLSEAQHNVEDKVPHVDLNKPADSSITTTNAMVFDNVPAGAKNCQLHWRSTAPNDENSFTVAGSGAAFSRQLLGFPSGDEIVSFDGLKKYQDPNAKWSQSLDFTGWTEMPGSHTGPRLNCATQVALELKGSDGPADQENRVFITLTETNGFYLTYEL
ncbi:hypothetical protein BCR34DRAFT_563323 [Clohesyomyces aquaticus]|uniref:Ubiquitin 3 binding protein But2 C-terminal domain-containing protein n=1 Tax=Clohesyomyces aquaticus TaxID=1231657 RepID=A0A1Y1ZR63_9PLEO|nr:hypothetical protein BCR34DRAFT_563323 [Clohesyomyces aquaticus]